MNLLDVLKENPFVLAPMAGITDCAYRSFMKEMGAGIVVTELISANGIEYGSERTLSLMRFQEMQRPVGIQLFGETPEIIAKGAQRVQALGADFVDLNFGCPVPKVVSKGAGSAVLKDMKQFREILRVTKAAIQIPLTIKIRTGWTMATRNATEACHIAYEEGVTWVAIHGRDRAQAYSGASDWNYISEVKSKSKIPIIGNGDILTADKANERLRESGCDAVMIGRGCLKNPWIFSEALAQHKGLSTVIDRDYMKVFQRLKFYLEKEADPRVTQIQLKKFASWFSAGYPGAATFRKDLFQTKSVDETLDLVNRFYDSIRDISQADTSNDGFLMGGHG